MPDCQVCLFQKNKTNEKANPYDMEGNNRFVYCLRERARRQENLLRSPKERPCNSPFPLQKTVLVE
jgi:hypothetical protein